MSTILIWRALNLRVAEIVVNAQYELDPTNRDRYAKLVSYVSCNVLPSTGSAKNASLKFWFDFWLWSTPNRGGFRKLLTVNVRY